MPRRARSDAPDELHHIIYRGIEHFITNKFGMQIQRQPSGEKAIKTSVRKALASRRRNKRINAPNRL